MKLFGAGGGGIAIAGHHVSYGLLAVLLSVPVAGLAIYQFRSGALGLGGVSSGVADTVDPSTLGQDTADASSGGGGGASDAALNNFGQEISSLNALLRGVRPLSAPAPGVQGSTYITNRYVSVSKGSDVTPPPAPRTFVAPGVGTFAATATGRSAAVDATFATASKAILAAVNRNAPTHATTAKLL